MDRNQSAWDAHLTGGWKVHFAHRFQSATLPAVLVGTTFHNLATGTDVNAKPRIDRQAVFTATVHEFPNRRQGLEVLCGRSQWCKHVATAESTDVLTLRYGKLRM